MDSPRWGELSHAYGSASDVPELLRQLEHKPAHQDANSEPWFSLWSALCHQGDAFDASYAAVPHLLRIALDSDSAIDFSFLSLSAAIEIARAQGRAPELPNDLADAYRLAIARLSECVAGQAIYSWSQDFTLAANAALAASKGYVDVAEAILNLDEFLIAKINAGDFE